MSLRSLQQQISSFALCSNLNFFVQCDFASYGTDSESFKLNFAILFADHHITCKLIFLCILKLTIWFIVDKTFSPNLHSNFRNWMKMNLTFLQTLIVYFGVNIILNLAMFEFDIFDFLSVYHIINKTFHEFKLLLDIIQTHDIIIKHFVLKDHYFCNDFIHH